MKAADGEIDQAPQFDEQLVNHDGRLDEIVEELAPGILLHQIPGHTPGLQSLSVHTARGWVVLASDAAHYYESIEHGTPFATHESMLGMLEGFRRLRKLTFAQPDAVARYATEIAL